MQPVTLFELTNCVVVVAVVVGEEGLAQWLRSLPPKDLLSRFDSRPGGGLNIWMIFIPAKVL